MKQRWARERQEKKEDRQLILKLHAALLQSFRGQHSKKMVCTRGVPGAIEALGKANSHFDLTQMGLGTVPPR